MSKTYIVSRNGGTVTKAPINDNKIPIYDNESALDADLNNLPDGTICATSSGHDDVIDQMKEYIRKQNSPDWNNAEAVSFVNSSYTVPSDGWLVGEAVALNGAITVKINGVVIGAAVSTNTYFNHCYFNQRVNLGDVVTYEGNLQDSSHYNLSFVPHK